MRIQLLPPSLEPWRGDASGREIAVLMSGGVDSSVTALLLKEAGWRVLGVTMKIPAPETDRGAEAVQVCRKLGVPHYFADARHAFGESVIEPFRSAYAAGRTPNPCVECNARLKFGAMWDLVESAFGVSRLATGHYARVVREDGRAFLARAGEAGRDQSYFVYRVPLERLPRLFLPVGEMSKSAVRSLAQARGLPVAEKPDSMELCFAGEGDYRQALGVSKDAPGPIVDAEGAVLGRHHGVWNYTVGQRRGLGVAAGEPLYVTRIDLERNAVVLGTREQVCTRRVSAARLHVLAQELPRPGVALYGKLRSYSEPSACTVVQTNEDSLTAMFEQPQFAPTPGQHLVLYDEAGRVVAGGEIVAEAGADRGPGRRQAKETT